MVDVIAIPGPAASGKSTVASRVAAALQIPREEIVLAMDAVVDPVSLFEPVYSDSGDTVCVMDQVRDQDCTDENWLERLCLRSAFQSLGSREKQILSLRFYDGKTQMEVANFMGISQAQVSRLEKGAISAMRKSVSIS